MKHLIRPVSLGALGVALIALIVSQPAIVVLGLSVWLGYVAYSSIKESGARRHESELSSEGRALIRPLKELRGQIAKLVEAFSHRPDVSIIGGEALKEADALLKHTGKLVEVHDQIVTTLKGRIEAEHDIARIEEKVAGSEDGPIKDALIESAVARQNELQRYEEIEQTKQRIVAKVKQAETALFDIKAKLSAGSVGAETDDLEQDELEGMVSRLKSLSASFDEAEELVKDRIE